MQCTAHTIGNLVRDPKSVQGVIHISGEVLPGLFHGGDAAGPGICGVIGQVRKFLDDAGACQGGRKSIHRVVTMVIAGFLPVLLEEAIEPRDGVAQECCRLAVSNLDPRLSLCVHPPFKVSAKEQSQIGARLPGYVACVGKLAIGKAIKMCIELITSELEEFELVFWHAVLLDCEGHAIDHSLPVLALAASHLDRGLVALRLAVVVRHAEGLVHERVIEGTREGDDVLDVHIGSEEVREVDCGARIGAQVAALLPKARLEQIASPGIGQTRLFDNSLRCCFSLLLVRAA